MKAKPSAFTRNSVLVATLSWVTLQAALAGSVQGVVRRLDGKPLAGAVVTVLETGQTSRTNPSGQYYLTDMLRGRANLVATGEGYFPVLATVQVQEAGITDHGFALKADGSLPIQKPAVKPLDTMRPETKPQYVIGLPPWQPPVVTQSGSVKDGLQITARSDKETYSSGESVVVTVALKNISEKDQTVGDTDENIEFEFVVTYEGNATPMTKYGAQSHKRWIDLQIAHSLGSFPGLMYSTLLHPGQERAYHFAVNRFQDMTLDGSYTIVVKRETDASTQLVADPIQVEIKTPYPAMQTGPTGGVETPGITPDPSGPK